MFYYLYQVTNRINGKIYVGVHKTKNLDDNYIGSGKLLKNAISKYGLENFDKQILEYFENEELMFSKEREIVTKEFVSRKDTYNLKIGGEGGFSFINDTGIVKFKGQKHTDQTKLKISQKNKGHKTSDAARLLISEANKRTNEVRGQKVSRALKNKPKSEEHKRKIAESIRLKRGIGSLVDPLPSKQM